MLKRKSLAAILAGITVLGAAGCGSSATASAPTAPKQPQTLVIYSAQGYDVAEGAAFQKATGIPTKVLDMSTGPLLARVAAEGNHPQWDVIWFDGNGAMAQLDSQGMLLRHWQPANTANYTSLGQSLVPGDQSYIPTGVSAAAAIAYNTKLVPPSQVPTSWHALLGPFFKNAIGMNNPAISGPTYPFVAGIFHQYGVAQGKAYFEALKQNGLHIYPTNGHTLKALETGQIKVAMFQDTAETHAVAKGEPIKVAYPQGGVTMLPSDMAIAKNAPDMAEAKKFVNFVLSPAGQKVMLTAGGGDSYFNPIIQGQNPNPARPQSGIKWNVVDPVWAGKNENAWVQWFTNNIVQ